jgi:HD superfamily phosphohydrolase YqeK
MNTDYPSALLPATFPDLTGDIIADARALLLANGKQATLQHVEAVAARNAAIAAQYGLDARTCEVCGYLHDIAAIHKPGDMIVYAEESGWELDAAERKHPFLLHQRVARVIAEQHFAVADERILSAIEVHTTLKASPSGYDMALFLADKLSWDQEGEPPFRAVVEHALERSLEAASLAYMEYALANGMILQPHGWFELGLGYLRRLYA